MATPRTGRPVGRPSLYTVDLAEEIASGIATGKTLIDQAKEPGMPDYITIVRWQNRYPEFRQMLLRAREEATHLYAEQALEIADREELDPAHKRIMIDTRLRLIGQWNRAIYGPKAANVSVTNTTTTTVATLNVAALPLEARDALEQALLNINEGVQYEQIGDGSDGELDSDD